MKGPRAMNRKENYCLEERMLENQLKDCAVVEMRS